MTDQSQPAGWYYAQGDPPGTHRYWDGSQWVGGAQPVPGASDSVSGAPALGDPARRMAARAIDWMVWTVIYVVVARTFVGPGTLASEPVEVSFATTMLVSVVVGGLILVYEMLMVALRGQTLGKMALSLRVTTPDGTPAGVAAAALRISPVFVLNVINPLLPGAGVIVGVIVAGVSVVLLFVDTLRQTVWDNMARTIVTTV
ncbi:MAG: RDD family protein [Acidimicrobiales bacterium]